MSRNRVETQVGVEFPDGMVCRMRRAICTRIPEDKCGIDVEMRPDRWRFYPRNEHGTAYLEPSNPRTGFVGRVYPWGTDTEPLEIFAGDWLEWRGTV